MQEFVNFILGHWQTLILLFSSFLFFILQLLFKKKPVNFYDSVKSLICQYAAAAVCKVENSGIKGSNEKLNFALNLLYHISCANLTYEEWSSLYKDFAVTQIELVLDAPEKKKG